MTRKKKKFADLDQRGSNNNPILQEIKRHGHFPPTDRPIGWDEEGFRKIFPTQDLPFQTVDEMKVHETSKSENKLIWGDNLAIMRSLPDASVDLVYIDPPFFSGRNYNLIFGDEDEKRTFRDIWDGGLQTYLAWMNARLWEINRLLKPTGNIFVHLDWHAAHYVKVEMDKIFGQDAMKNEIIWHYRRWSNVTKNFQRMHDTILFYAKNAKSSTFNLQYQDYANPDLIEDTVRGFVNGKLVRLKDEEGNYIKREKENKGVPMHDVWEDINFIAPTSSERIGYPTQKPEAFLERIIKSTTNPNDVVLDCFCGGGTTLAVSQKLGRKWIGCDISRIAVQVSSDRLTNINDSKGIEITDKKAANKYHHSIQYHGTYVKSLIKQYTAEEFRAFVSKCYEADRYKKGNYIHATKGNYAIFIGPPDSEITHTHVMSFYSEMRERGFRYGQLIGWKVSTKAQDEIERVLNSARKGEVRDIQAVTIKMVDIDSDEFKGGNIRFVNKPMCNIRNKALSKDKLEWEFDATNSSPQSDAKILHVQWDFNYSGKFRPNVEWNFEKDDKLNPTKIINHKFSRKGEHEIALRILDSKGGVAIHSIKIVA